MSKHDNGRPVTTGQNHTQTSCAGTQAQTVPIYARCHGRRHEYHASSPALPAGWQRRGKKYTNSNYPGVVARLSPGGNLRLYKRTTGKTPPDPALLDAAASDILGGQPAPFKTVTAAPGYHLEVDVPASWAPKGDVRRFTLKRQLVALGVQVAELRLSASKGRNFLHFAVEVFWAEHTMEDGTVRHRR
jgi:hypothetical protein